MRFTELPICLQAAYVRQPRRRSFASSAEKQNLRNNYLAKAKPRDLQKTHSVTKAEHRATTLGGRHAKGAGAPHGNHNAAGGALYRLCLRRIRLKQQLDRQHDQLLVWAAVGEQLQTRATPTPKTIFPSNNYLAEGEGLARAAIPTAAATPSPPLSTAITIILRARRSRADRRGGLPHAPKRRADPSRISQIPSVKRLDVRIGGLYG